MKRIYIILYLLIFNTIFVYTKKNNSHTIYMIRHAEKPKNGGIGLSRKGEKRAKCILHKFSKYNIKNIYTQKYKKSGKRKRPYLTGEPLAKKLGLTINTSCERNDIKCITNDVLRSSKNGNVLVIWEHDNLEKIAKKLLKKLDINSKNYDNKLNTSNTGYNYIWKIHNKKLYISTEGCD